MAMNESAAIVAAGGYLYHGPVGTPVPAGWETAELGVDVLSGFDNVGFTSLEDLPEFGSDGGDSETLGSWQRKVMRQQQTEASTDYLVFNAYQFDADVLQMYWGQGDVTAGRLDISEVGGIKIERAFFMVITDGAVRIAFYAPRASFSREDSLELSVESFAQWPIRATWLQYQTEPLFSWLGEGIQPPAAPIPAA